MIRRGPKIAFSVPRSLYGRVSRLVSDWRSDQRGVSFVEFAFIAPLLILVMLGMSDLSPAIMADFHVAHANESTADIAGEYTEMQTSDMANVMAIAGDVLSPLPVTATNPSIRLTSIYSNAQNQAKVQWSCGEGSLPAYTANTVVTSLPTGTPVAALVTSTSSLPSDKNSTIIMSEISYTYTPTVGYVLKQPVTMTDTSYLVPRESSYVGFPWDGVASDAPSVPTSTTTNASVTLSNGAICSYAK